MYRLYVYPVRSDECTRESMDGVHSHSTMNSFLCSVVSSYRIDIGILDIDIDFSILYVVSSMWWRNPKRRAEEDEEQKKGIKKS